MKLLQRFLCFIAFSVLPLLASAQLNLVKNGAFYFSWGYNTEYYSKSDLYIDQPGLNSNYVFKDISAKDHIGWDQLFQHALSIPQYNYRLGYFFNKKQDWAFEVNFDHTKYIVRKDQVVQVVGQRNGQAINSPILITDSVLIYFLNNGANFLLFNLVKKKDFYSSPMNNLKVAGLLKGGVGPVIPHVENVIFGERNEPHFQIGGWNTAIEATLKVTLFNHVFLEFCNKLDYARYSNLRIYKGLAHQSFFTYEIIGNLGYTFSCGKEKKTEESH
jgi:hypothetical protein